jgi:hypothetical protein
MVVVAFALVGCSGTRKTKRDDAAVKSPSHSVDSSATPIATTNLPTVATGSINVVVRWPTPSPSAFIYASPCLSDDEVAPVLTTTRLVVGAVVEVEGDATAKGPDAVKNDVEVAFSDCMIKPAVAVVATGGTLRIRRNAVKLASMSVKSASANRTAVFPVNGHTVAVTDLAAGNMELSVGVVATATIVVTHNAAATSNRDGIAEFAAAVGDHKVTVVLPATSHRSMQTGTAMAHVVAGQVTNIDINLRAP